MSNQILMNTNYSFWNREVQNPKFEMNLKVFFEKLCKFLYKILSERIL